jgi:hypothetical protein
MLRFFIQSIDWINWNMIILLGEVTTEECMSGLQCRSFARDSPIDFTDDDLSKLMEVIRQKESNELGAHNAPYKFYLPGK